MVFRDKKLAGYSNKNSLQDDSLQDVFMLDNHKSSNKLTHQMSLSCLWPIRKETSIKQEGLSLKYKNKDLIVTTVMSIIVQIHLYLLFWTNAWCKKWQTKSIFLDTPVRFSNSA